MHAVRLLFKSQRSEQVHETTVQWRGKGIIKMDWEVFWILLDLALYSKARI